MTIQRWSKDVKYACRVLSYMIPFAVLPNLDENEENVEIRRLVFYYMNIVHIKYLTKYSYISSMILKILGLPPINVLSFEF